MMKFIKAAYVYTMYIVGAPVLLAFSIVILAYYIIKNKKEFGKFDVIDTAKSLFEGVRIGHLANKAFINDCSFEEYCQILEEA